MAFVFVLFDLYTLSLVAVCLLETCHDQLSHIVPHDPRFLTTVHHRPSPTTLSQGKIIASMGGTSTMTNRSATDNSHIPAHIRAYDYLIVRATDFLVANDVASSQRVARLLLRSPDLSRAHKLTCHRILSHHGSENRVQSLPPLLSSNLPSLISEMQLSHSPSPRNVGLQCRCC